jgi:hypothetical protein
VRPAPAPANREAQDLRLLAVAVLALLASFLCVRESLCPHGIFDPWPFVAAAVLFAVAGCLIAIVARRVREQHASRMKVCRRCDYDLRGLPPDSPCPECGRTNPPPRA